MNNNTPQEYTAVTYCSSTKYRRPHYIKAVISSDQNFEDELEQLMSCEHLESDLEYV